MRAAVLKLVSVVLLAAPLAACATAPGILAQNEPAHISKVHVSAAPGVSSPRFTELLQARTTHYAARFGEAGAPKELRILVERHSYKNPALSLLVGDANVARGRVAVVDTASGRVHGEAETGAVDTRALNGVVGAIIAVAQDKQVVDGRLADDFAKAALRQAYGDARAAAVLDRPEAAPAQPTPEPAPAAPAEKAKPAPKPKPTPVTAGAVASDRTAMAGAPVSAPR